jgi:hypothetical protein
MLTGTLSQPLKYGQRQISQAKSAARPLGQINNINNLGNDNKEAAMSTPPHYRPQTFPNLDRPHQITLQMKLPPQTGATFVLRSARRRQTTLARASPRPSLQAAPKRSEPLTIALPPGHYSGKNLVSSNRCRFEYRRRQRPENIINFSRLHRLVLT